MTKAPDLRLILITGAAGTLGRAATLASARAGARVVMLDKRVKPLEQLYDEVRAAGYPEPAIYPMDLAGATDHDIAELATVIDREFGPLHGMLHAAVEFRILGPLSDVDTLQFERTLRVNCVAAVQLTRALMPPLMSSGTGIVVFLSDSHARLANAYWGAYGISKVALEAAARILFQETETGGKLSVRVVVPGPFRSPIHLKAFPGADHTGLPEASAIGAQLADLLLAPLRPVSPASGFGITALPPTFSTGHCDVR